MKLKGSGIIPKYLASSIKKVLGIPFRQVCDSCNRDAIHQRTTRIRSVDLVENFCRVHSPYSGPFQDIELGIFVEELK